MGIAGFQQNKIVSAVITTPPTKVIYFPGDLFDSSGMEVTLTYENGTTSVIDDFDTTDEGFVLQSGDTYVVIIIFTQGQAIKIQQDIEVRTPTLVGPVITKSDQTITITKQDAAQDYQIFENGEFLGTLMADGSWVPQRNLGYPYIKFTSPSNFSIYRTSTNHNGSFQYSTDNLHWSPWNGLDTIYSADYQGTQTLLLRGSNNTKITYGNTGQGDHFRFNGSNITISGQLDALFDYVTCYNQQTINLAAYAGSHLFYQSPIIDASELHIKSVSQSNYTYWHLFAYCRGLVYPPQLDAPVLGPMCFHSMFFNCTSLIEAPPLPWTNLASYCYTDMFYGCSALTVAPVLPATILTLGCYKYMFAGTSITTTPELNVTTMARQCYAYMFEGCTRLTTISSPIPGPTHQECYYSMFTDCTSLTQCPSITITSTYEDCCSRMFYNSKITDASNIQITASTVEKRALSYMFYGCSNLTKPAIFSENCVTLKLGGCQSMYHRSGITRLPKIYFTNLSNASNTMTEMFRETNIKISDTQSAEYPYPWRIPITGTASGEGSSWSNNMFYRTKGTFTSNPSANTTYYTNNEPI